MTHSETFGIVRRTPLEFNNRCKLFEFRISGRFDNAVHVSSDTA